MHDERCLGWCVEADDNSRYTHFIFEKTELQNHFKSAFTTIDKQIKRLWRELREREYLSQKGKP
jgi:membrane-anchored protein YejM (alkaline phosphatase superfamily)